ncbi:MAG: hypothetical protein A2534_03200 [Candidatus Magasanikbacteria bacterium RIFOXYD2_FULL_39_9]|uniref:Uncharacterized protein n=1 Tax=Candidatus Magasanikbacteria bacterium RIFOXYD1_FULL_40_23 TaxID=1798705 RepID=A0A1F6PA87_9BACT|nr:MAG: hypothetical protein A2534_03200 [Candidatus Magasanikbacteria bacterium RIFOXYD2_FULL_39_9]OGH93097.1 MAG: hypothetical protein A2563_00205 [Candidatus Magasanikbacteria bacterium RIFOXYD1_FULL_40_23]
MVLQYCSASSVILDGNILFAQRVQALWIVVLCQNVFSVGNGFAKIRDVGNITQTVGVGNVTANEGEGLVLWSRQRECLDLYNLG